MIELLLKDGADPHAKTTVDHYTTPREEAETFGCLRAVEALRKFTAQ
jgi:hypothetical protein